MASLSDLSDEQLQVYHDLLSKKQGASAPQPDESTISAVPPPHGVLEKIGRWTDNVSHDLKYGTDLTGVGALLKGMGAHGLDVGNSAKIGEFMGSLPLGLLQAAKGVTEVPSQPWQGTKDVVGGLANAATIPSAFVGVPAAQEGVSELAGMIPSAERAAGKFQQVAGAMKGTNVDLAQPMAIATEAKGVGGLGKTGSTVPKIVTDLANRAKTATEIPFDESRLFQTSAGRLSTAERMATNPQMKAKVAELAHALANANESAAEQAGVGDLYREAITEYRRAARIQGIKDTTGELAEKYAAHAMLGAGAAAGYGLYKEITK